MATVSHRARRAPRTGGGQRVYSAAGKRSRDYGASAATRSSKRAYTRAQGYTGTVPLTRNFDKCTFDAAQSVSLTNCYSTTGAVVTTPFTVGSSAFPLNQIPQGNSSITRVGRRCGLSAVAIRAVIAAGATTTATNCVTLLVWDRNPNQNSTMPTFAQILNSQATMSLTNKDFAPRFKILRRWDHQVIGSAGNQYTDKSVQYIDEFIPLKNKQTIWTAADTTGLVSNMQAGGLYMYLVGDALAGTTAPTMVLSTRVYFQDE